MSVTYLKACDGNTARRLGEELDAGRVTHAVVAFRSEDGGLHYHLVGQKDMTYLVGMLERVKTHMHCLDSFDIPGVD